MATHLGISTVRGATYFLLISRRRCARSKPLVRQTLSAVTGRHRQHSASETKPRGAGEGRDGAACLGPKGTSDEDLAASVNRPPRQSATRSRRSMRAVTSATPSLTWTSRGDRGESLPMTNNLSRARATLSVSLDVPGRAPAKGVPHGQGSSVRWDREVRQDRYCRSAPQDDGYAVNPEPRDRQSISDHGSLR